MKIVVIGGTGLIGSKLVSKLNQLGYDAIAASPNTGVNTLTGEGLDEVLEGAQVVVDVSNSPSFEDNAVMHFFETSNKNLLAAEAKAGVGHHIALSVVGTDRLLQSGYFRAKQMQENLITQSDIPFTIVHATQFFEFLRTIVASAGQAEEIHLSSSLFQPMASDDVAEALAAIALDQPINGLVEIAGPKKISLAGLVQEYMARIGDTRKVVGDPNTRYFGAEIDDATLVPGKKAKLGEIDFDTWFKNQEDKIPVSK